MPDWTEHVRPRLSRLRLSPTREAEIVEELSQHLEDRWRELIAGGMSPDEATRVTLADFRDGNVLADYIAPLRQAHPPAAITPGAPSGSRLLSDLWQDLRYAARTLRKRPGPDYLELLKKDGAFRFQGVAPGEYHLVLTRNGFDGPYARTYYPATEEQARSEKNSAHRRSHD